MAAPPADMRHLRRRDKALSRLEYLKALHWDDATRMFLDWGPHTEDMTLTTTEEGQVHMSGHSLQFSSISARTCESKLRGAFCPGWQGSRKYW
jgi:hypothetical protein